MSHSDNRAAEELHVHTQLSTSSIQKSPNLLLASNSHASGATTAVTLASADQAELSNLEQDFRLDHTVPSAPKIPSVFGSPALASVCSSDNDILPDTPDRAPLTEFLGSLILNLPSRPTRGHKKTDAYNGFSANNTKFDEEFIKREIIINKQGKGLNEKLKHFFMLSTAGKLIYSMNGDDEVLLGYMGLITTIISSFQEGMGKQFEKIQLSDFTMVVMVKSPLILVAITRIPHEMFPSSALMDSILENQLKFLHNYVLAVISESVIEKHFKRGMNFDLRKLLSAQDYILLDTLAMLLTYGFYTDDHGHHVLDNSLYLRSLLGNATQCARITNTSRMKLNGIFASAKKIKLPKEDSDSISVFQGTFGVNIDDKYLASDLLFGFVTLEDKIISYLRPKNHQLCNQDISTLLATTRLYFQTLSQEKSMDLWIPLCMPNFNNSGFLYCYLRQFAIKNLTKPLTLILLSGSKNSFYEMKEVADYVISEVTKSKSLNTKLGKELSQNLRLNWVLGDLNISTIKHFIYKQEEYNQIYMDEYLPIDKPASFETLKSLFELIYLYANLINSTNYERMDAGNGRKLTYTRWQQEDNLITGFLLTDLKYQFYCLCIGPVSSKVIIEHSLRIIRWCDKHRKRLFVRQGSVF